MGELLEALSGADIDEGIQLDRVRTMNVSDGDVLVLEHPLVLSNAAAERVLVAFKRVTGKDIKVIILEEKMTLAAVLRAREVSEQ